MILQPVEIIADPDFGYRDALYDIKKQIRKTTVSLYDIPMDVDGSLQHILQVSKLDGYGLALAPGRRQTCCLLLNYICQTQSSNIHSNSISFHHRNQRVLLDNITIKNLELFTSSYDHNPSHSLFGVINTTNTAMGARTLSQWIINPTQDKKTLEMRLNHIQSYSEDLTQVSSLESSGLIQELKKLNDIPKLLSTIIYRKPRPTLLAKIRNNLEIILGKSPNTPSVILNNLQKVGLPQNTITALQQYHQTLQEQLQDECTDNQINYIADNVDPLIDQLRDTAFHSDERLIQYQQQLVQASGITNIKLKYITNQGYYIELSPSNVAAFETIIDPQKKGFNLTRRQTLKTAQRYSSPYLSGLETEVLQAKQQLIQEEKRIFMKLIESLETLYPVLSECSDYIATIDIYSSHALFALQHKLVKPTLTNTGTTSIHEGRHSVIEKFLPHHEQFITNNLRIGETNTASSHSQKNENNSGFIHILTGPNMGGKSTFLRQNALIVLMAHCGLYVPAKEATITVVDAIFARVGSGDALSKNQSTFMTEMIEVANILHNATQQSFIVFDELGRGTSTFDGLALTKAIIQHIAVNIKANTLLATHYHELIQLEGRVPGVKNYSVSVYETDKEVVFLKKVTRGGADRSYGIEVAKLAGIPTSITTLANRYLETLENEERPTKGTTTVLPLERNEPTNDRQRQKIKTLLNAYNLNEITPLQALQLLTKLKDEAKK